MPDSQQVTCQPSSLAINWAALKTARYLAEISSNYFPILKKLLPARLSGYAPIN